MSVEDFSESSKIDLDICNNYLEGVREPSIEDLLQISLILEVSTDYLIGKTDTSAPALTDDETELLEYYNKLSRMNRHWVLGQIVDLLKKQEESSVVA